MERRRLAPNKASKDTKSRPKVEPVSGAAWGSEVAALSVKVRSIYVSFAESVPMPNKVPLKPFGRGVPAIPPALKSLMTLTVLLPELALKILLPIVIGGGFSGSCQRFENSSRCSDSNGSVTVHWSGASRVTVHASVDPCGNV